MQIGVLADNRMGIILQKVSFFERLFYMMTHRGIGHKVSRQAYAKIDNDQCGKNSKGPDGNTSHV